MKTSTLLTALAAANAASAVKFVSGPQGWPEKLGFQVTHAEDYGNLYKSRLSPRAQVPKRVDMKSRNPHIPNSKSVKIRYGPYTVPGAKVPGGEGMITNRPNPSVDKPCQSCYILGMNAGLEYMDGADANTDTLMWLHHMVMFNIGTGAWDATCTVFGAPHLIVGSMPQSSERFFSSGNERTTTFFNPPWANVTNLGYPIYPADRFGLIIDLMNMNMQAKQVYLTIYYDYVDGHPANFDEVKPVWMDAAQCGTSEIGGRTPGAKFDFGSPAWVANFEGEVLGAGGHLHDGGTQLDIIVDNKVICNSMPTYGTDEQALIRANAAKLGDIAPLPDNSKMSTPQVAPKAAAPKAAAPKAAPKAAKGKVAAVEAPPPANGQGGEPAHGGHGHAGGQHIIAMSICAENKSGLKNLPISPLGIKNVAKGQKWTLRAYYDYNKFAGMKAGTSNRMSTVMGISIMYAKTAVKRKAA